MLTQSFINLLLAVGCDFKDLHGKHYKIFFNQLGIGPPQFWRWFQVLTQELADQRPFIDRLGKVGPSLAKLCKPQEAGNVQARLDDILDRYQSLKSSVKVQGEKLREKDKETQQVIKYTSCPSQSIANQLPINQSVNKSLNQPSI